MKKYKFIALVMASCLYFPLSAFAQHGSEQATAIKFFASNNTSEINLYQAFDRLKGSEQQALQAKTKQLLQLEKLRPAKFENILGTYKLSSDHEITADNSEIFISSTQRRLLSVQSFKLAQELAKGLKQESVALFIPSQKDKVGDTLLQFKTKAYTINEAISLIHARLPLHYSQAFSLHLNATNAHFNQMTVNAVEWLGREIKPSDLKKAFPQENIIAHAGKAYLVYKNGQKQRL